MAEAPRTQLILASRSPQRAAILEAAGVRFEARPADVLERTEGEPRQVARENARAKALAVARQIPQARVLGADTVVALEGDIYAKPRDEGQAREHLLALSGRTHQVVGGLAVATDDGIRDAAIVTEVTFRELSDADLEWYLASGEWRQRAGAYAIQGRGAALVRSISGDYLNVVGLPLAALLDLVPDLLHGP